MVELANTLTTEEVVIFGENQSLSGVITNPVRAGTVARPPGVILLNSGLVHRVGPNRVYVKLARQLAALGMTVLRFDYSGVGDSPSRRDSLALEETRVSETREAMDFLSRTKGIEKFLLMGICSGAINSFNAAVQDPRVSGAALINPLLYSRDFGSSASDLDAIKQAKRYWRGSLLNPKSWLRALAGRADYRMMSGQVKNIFLRRSNRSRAGAGVADTYRDLNDRGVRLLLVYSAEDRRWEDRHRMVFGDYDPQRDLGDNLEVEVIAEASHTFTLLSSQERLVEVIQGWIRRKSWA